MAGAGGVKRRGAGSGGRSVRPRHEAEGQAKEATSHSESDSAGKQSDSGKQQHEEEASSTSSSGLSGEVVTGPARRTRNKSRAEKRAAAVAAAEEQKKKEAEAEEQKKKEAEAEEQKKKEAEAAAAALREEEAAAQKHFDALQKKKEEDLKKIHEEELESLRKKHESEIESLRCKHKQQIQVKMKKQQENLDAMKKQLEVDACKMQKKVNEADCPSPTEPVSTNNSPHSSGYQMKMHRDYLPEYDLSRSKSKPVSSKKSKEQNKLKQQLQADEDKELESEEELEVEERKKQPEEEAHRRSLDRSLKRDDTSFKDRAAHGELVRQQAERQRAVAAKVQHDLEQQRKEKEAQLERERKQKALIKLEGDFLEFLNSFERKGIDGAFYKRKAQFMKVCNNFDLRIRFEDVMKYSVMKESNLTMAMDLLNYDTNDLLPLVEKFIVDVAFGTEESEAVKGKATLSFIDRPPSITPVAVLMGMPDNVVERFTDMFGQGHLGYTLTQMACGVLGGSLFYIFQSHSLGRTWHGDFTIEHLYAVGNSQFGIAKVPEHLPGNALDQFSAKKKDIQQLVKIFLPLLDCRNPENQQGTPMGSDLPLYISQLDAEIDQMTAEDLKQDWYPEFLLNFPALKRPLPRHSLVCDTRLAMRNCKVNSAVYDLFDGIPKLYEGQHRIRDWRDDCRESTNKLLKDTYHHNEDKMDLTKHHISGTEPFPPTLLGITSYDRNLRQHGAEKVDVSSIAELEVFSATQLVKYLHFYLKNLLKDGLTDEKRNRDFHDIWLNYKTSTPKTVDGSSVQPGPIYSFWD